MNAENDAAYREQAEATIADLRARVSHYEARIAEQIEPEVSEDDLRAFIFEVVRRNDSLPIRLLRHYRITPRVFPPAVCGFDMGEGDECLLDAGHEGPHS